MLGHLPQVIFPTREVGRCLHFPAWAVSEIRRGKLQIVERFVALPLVSCLVHRPLLEHPELHFIHKAGWRPSLNLELSGQFLLTCFTPLDGGSDLCHEVQGAPVDPFVSNSWSCCVQAPCVRTGVFKIDGWLGFCFAFILPFWLGPCSLLAALVCNRLL